MTQSIEKTNCVDHIDRTSDLPGNVIDDILKHLNITELIRTSILSKKWRYMWMSVPELEFCEDFFSMFDDFDDPTDTEISKIITEVLFLHNGPIYKFSLFPHRSNLKSTIEYLNRWILFLSRRGIKHLQLLYNATYDNKIPSHIFSCQELTHLRLSGFNLSVPPNFCGLKKLLNLYLEHNTYEFGALENLISGCPLLEKLDIKFFGAMKPICLKKAKNLIDLRILISQERVSGLIKSLPKIQRLTITSSYRNKIVCSNIIPPTQLISLKYLKLIYVNLNEREEFLYIVNVLKSASNLVELDIMNHYYDRTQDPDQPEEFECNSCCLNQLQTVNIYIRTGSKYTMNLIRFILANASSLKTLTFEVGFYYKKLDAARPLSLSQDLLCMERASPRARVVFRYLEHFQW